MNNVQELAAPVGRVFMALIFLISGLNKISAFEATQGYMEAMGVPGALLPLAILTETLLGLAVIVGFRTRVAAFGLAGFTLLSAILFHANFDDQVQTIMFMKNVAIVGGLLVLIAHGAGAWSLDNRRTDNV